jgi:hypothetical protein
VPGNGRRRGEDRCASFLWASSVPRAFALGRVALVSANDGVRMSVEAGAANNLKKKFAKCAVGLCGQ